MKAHRRMQAEMQSQHSQPDSSMTFALVVVVIVFIICRAPLLIWRVMWLLGWSSAVGWCYVGIMYNTLLAFNSAVNVIIYIILNRRFRNVLLANVCRRRSAIPVVTANVMTMPERANVKRVMAVTLGFRFVTVFKLDNDITIRCFIYTYIHISVVY